MQRRYVHVLILAALSMVVTMLVPVTQARAEDEPLSFNWINARFGEQTVDTRGPWGTRQRQGYSLPSNITSDPEWTEAEYQWMRDGVDIPGATQSDYVPGPYDADQYLTYRVTLRAPGGYVGTAVSPKSRYRVARSYFDKGPKPTISGDAKINGTLTAHIDLDESLWHPQPEPEGFTYQWMTDQGDIEGATGPTYEVRPEDRWRTISVRVSANRTYFYPYDLVSDPTPEVPSRENFLFRPTPVIEGDAVFGNTLSVDPGQWRPEALRYAYAWYRDGVETGTEATYKLVASDVGKQIKVRVTATGIGLLDATSPYSEGVVVEPKTLVATPGTVHGTLKVGETLTLESGTWDPHDATVARQWMRDFDGRVTEIQGATGTTYTTTGEDHGARIFVRETGSLPGYATQTVETAPTARIEIADFPGVPPVSVSGSPYVGQELTATHADWPAPAQVAYQWYRDGSEIKGATEKTYTPTSADIGRGVKVIVTGSARGYVTATAEAAPVGVKDNVFVNTQRPSIVGDIRPGGTVRLLPGAWTPEADRYLRAVYCDDRYIGAIGTWGYELPEDLEGCQLKMRVEATGEGFRSATAESLPIPLAKWELANVERPELSVGTAYVGEPVTVSKGTWTHEPDRYTYQWYTASGNTPINGATGESFTPGPEHVNKNLSVGVFAHRDGYTTVQARSTTNIDIRGRFTEVPVPEVVGEPELGSVLTVKTAGWGPVDPTTVTYEWYRDGLRTHTGDDYRVVQSDLGKRMTVVVKGHRNGYDDAEQASAPFMIGNDRITDPPTPTISGVHRVGEELTAHTGTWPEGWELSYQWVADSIPIPDQNASSYTVGPESLGKTIGVRVIGLRPGFTSAIAESGYTTKTGLPIADRLSSGNRYGTAAEVSREAFPNPSAVDSVVVAMGEDFPDSLSAAPFAAKLGGPLLLVQPRAVPADTVAELKRLSPERIYIVGGSGVVSDSVARTLEGYASASADKVTRLFGDNRFETSLAVAEAGWGRNAGNAFFATGWGFPDALAAGAAAAGGVPGESSAFPVVLVPGGQSELDARTRDRILALGIQRGFIAGGDGVLSAGIERSINSVIGATAERFSGSNRFETSAKVAEVFHKVHGSMYYATGWNFPDALAGSVAAGVKGAPLMLTQPTCVPGVVNDQAFRIKPDSAFVLGGSGVVGDDVLGHTVCPG